MLIAVHEAHLHSRGGEHPLSRIAQWTGAPREGCEQAVTSIRHLLPAGSPAHHHLALIFSSRRHWFCHDRCSHGRFSNAADALLSLRTLTMPLRASATALKSGAKSRHGWQSSPTNETCDQTHREAGSGRQHPGFAGCQKNGRGASPPKVCYSVNSQACHTMKRERLVG